jgi:hypothetical protein
MFLANFAFNKYATESSSSSESSTSESVSISTSSSSESEIIIPTLPSNRSIVFDNNRMRLWWVDDVWVYMLDVRNKQIQTYDIRNDLLYNAVNIDVELSTGNAFVICQNIHNDWLLLQLFRDNNVLLGKAYI